MGLSSPISGPSDFSMQSLDVDNSRVMAENLRILRTNEHNYTTLEANKEILKSYIDKDEELFAVLSEVMAKLKDSELSCMRKTMTLARIDEKKRTKKQQKEFCDLFSESKLLSDQICKFQEEIKLVGNRLKANKTNLSAVEACIEKYETWFKNNMVVIRELRSFSERRVSYSEVSGVLFDARDSMVDPIADQQQPIMQAIGM
ncbi:MAG: hypothetical protein JXR42_00540 [Gammaproteobacteria bacterium]|nr:hypothetical protein [Gammaproteobacteria bacterium]